MKDKYKVDVSHTDEFNRMYQEMIKQEEDRYKVKSEHTETEEETKPKYEDEVNGEYYSTPKYLVRPSGYQFVDENGNVINATKIALEKKKKEYPKTYEECCKVMNYFCNPEAVKTTHKEELIRKFQFLLLYRDAYWKIAGEEMGLGKPWEPDWKNDAEFKFVIICRKNCVIRETFTAKDVILAFPTREMRDAFYENFKELIESAKELL